MSEAQREQAMRRFTVLRPFLEDGMPLAAAAAGAGVAYRTIQRWLARYRAGGLVGLADTARRDRGSRRFPEQLVLLIEGLALQRPAPSAAAIQRQVAKVARDHGWPVPGYDTVYDVVSGLDPALVVLAHDGAKRYREVFDLVYRREASAPNEIWQADHTELDLWVLTPSGQAGRPWLTVIEDDHSRAVSGYAVNLGAPCAFQTALALHHAIWRKADPAWHVCGIPGVFYTDHGSDFTSAHLEQVAADLKIRLVFSLPGQPRGRGKIERLLDTINQMCLSALPGYAPRGTKDRAGQARLSLAELDAAIGKFIVSEYHRRPHSETGEAPQSRWEAGGFLPHMPESLELLDLLLLTVANARKVHPDGIHFQGLRYLDPTLAAFVGEAVIIRYDPRDLAEISVFYNDAHLCRAVCAELADRTISLKDITAARNARRRSPTSSTSGPASSTGCWPSTATRHRTYPRPTLPAPVGPHRPPPSSSDTGRNSPMDDTAKAIELLPTVEPPPLVLPEPEAFIVTKEHRRFIEFADACRRHRSIGLCYGAPGVGKTLSARHYARWDEVLPVLTRWQHHHGVGADRPDWHTLLYTPTVSATPRNLDKELIDLSRHLAVVRTRDLFDNGTYSDPHGSSPFTELLIVDEADRLRVPVLEALRDHYDRSYLGLILIGMPGIEKRFARYPQLYSRVGFVHHYRPLSAGEQAFVLARHWPDLGFGDPDDFTTAEAVAAIARITNGNFRLTARLVAQVQRILEINQMATVTKEVVETARESLVIGVL